MNKIFSISNDFVNSRLDRWFRRNVSDVPQSLIEKNIRRGNIKVNNMKKKSSYKLQNKDQIFVSNMHFAPNKNTENNERYKPNKKELSL